jgi:glycosyltransferase involved in cell wall biosynthesis
MSEDEMLKRHSLIYFAPEKWDGLWRNRQQLMSVFARQNRVLFVEPRPHLRPTLAGFQRGDLRLSDVARPSVRRVSKDLFVFSYPVWAPISGRSPLKQLTRTVRQRALGAALKKLELSQPIVWLSRPDMVDVIHEIPATRLLVYHIVDEYTAYSGHTPHSRRYTEQREKEMLALADAVVVVSKKLYEAKRPLNPNTHLVPNGVDFRAFSAALADPHLPDDLQAVKRPRLGYAGLIGDKLDLNLLEELARQNPGWSLVFLGEVRVMEQTEAWHRLLALSNVHYLGRVTVSQVPHYLKGFDAGLMPYVQNRHAEHIDPLKLYDYLAAGLPVVSTDIAAAREFGLHVHLADTPQGFTHAVRAALADTTAERRQARRHLASQHTWETRVKQLSVLIKDQLTAGSQQREWKREML